MISRVHSIYSNFGIRSIEHAYGSDLATPLESEILRGHAQVQKDKENFVVLCLRPQLNVASGNFTS